MNRRSKDLHAFLCNDTSFTQSQPSSAMTHSNFLILRPKIISFDWKAKRSGSLELGIFLGGTNQTPSRLYHVSPRQADINRWREAASERRSGKFAVSTSKDVRGILMG